MTRAGKAFVVCLENSCTVVCFCRTDLIRSGLQVEEIKNSPLGEVFELEPILYVVDFEVSIWSID